MPKLPAETRSYQKLVTDLRDLIEKAQLKALSAVNEIRVLTYWQMGKRMARLKELANPTQAGGFIARLATDLRLDASLLSRVFMFYRTWPKGIPRIKDGSPLSWAHYSELLSIKDPKQREFYLKTASLESWGRDTLRKAIQKDFFTIQKLPEKLKAGEPLLERSDDPMHIYKAVVERVVDGDTLLARVDLGFEVWISQRFRFRGINTAEIMKDGIKRGEAPDRAEQAKAFVEERLKGIKFVVVKTYKADIFGRYVAYLYYSPTLKKKEEVAMKGFFLNAELLAAGLTDPVF